MCESTWPFCGHAPEEKRYETEATKITALETDMSLVKQVVREHSEKIQKMA
ncbi:hypothetical protein [Fusibacillus kribbianus]|uniref:Uncharacterized protein n=1 Tax=Fusibacillus kribbianus TaxID=3044208 RepID=A0AAP4B9Z8_9FIRM|nr:hypothetical protein [Ruminococcus sp. YH-rum2234]MDI9241597.1 hypothetical protein [Ruminococcus sp. YH-rum2234]